MDPVLTETPEFVHVFSGNGILDGRQPVAHRYGGHQFGVSKQKQVDLDRKKFLCLMTMTWYEVAQSKSLFYLHRS